MSLTFWKIAASASRLLLWLAVACWGLFILAWVILHGVIVPRIDDFRPRLEMEASKALNVPVKIGGIKVTSSGFIPSFELTNIALLDPQGRQALHLPRILVAISPSSLLRLNAEQLYIDQPELEIRRDVYGKFYVAGLDFSKSNDHAADGLDWFFSQPEFIIHNGTIRWVDEQPNGALGVPPPLVLAQVDFVSRNPFNKHLLRLDATPPPEWGERFALNGIFTQSLLSRDKGKWQDWTGKVHANFSKVDVSQLSRHVKLSSRFGRGVGALRVWTDINKGTWASATADVALTQFDATLGEGLEPLALQSMSGRFYGKQITHGFEFSTQNLQFQTRDGLRWPGGNVFFSQSELMKADAGQSDPARTASKQAEGKGEFRADKLDLAAISLIANRLPLGEATHAKLASFAPQGVIQNITATWHGNLDAPRDFAAKGLVTGLQLASQRSDKKRGEGSNVHEEIGRPGVKGAQVDFDLNLTGGTAKVLVLNGMVDVPGVFEEPVIPVTQLSGDVKWRISPLKDSNPKSKNTTDGEEHIEFSVTNLVLNNADAEGTGQLTWRTSDPATAVSKHRFPGELDLQAHLSKADAARVWRYLPMGIPKSARDYVREAVVQGSSKNVDFTIKGDMSDMPSRNPKLGEFRIAAKVDNARVAYVPRKLQSAEDLPWPELQKLNGDLLIDRLSLSVKSDSSGIAGLPSLAISQALVSIPDLTSTVVNVNTQGSGKLAEVLGFINGSPLKPMIDQALSKSKIDGNGGFKLDLSLPIADIRKSRVAGAVTFLGNNVQITPNSPPLMQTKGTVKFTEKSFDIQGATAQLYGGDIRFEGGTVAIPAAGKGIGTTTNTPVSTAASVLIRGQGIAHAQGLQQAVDLGFIPNLAKYATGSTPYSAVLKFKQGEPELSVQSNLVGIGIDLPAPMNKPAQTSWPLVYENSLLESSQLPERDGKIRLKDKVHLTLDKLLEVRLTRDLQTAEPKVMQGGISVGFAAGESLPEPVKGIAANLNLAHVDIDQWSTILTQQTSVKPLNTAPNDYLPSTIGLRAKELIVMGRKIENIVVGGSLEGSTWRANVDARQLSGYVEYRQASSTTGNGRVYARLARLDIAESQASDVEQLLDEQPTNIPAIDLIVEEFEFKGRKLGRVEIEAVNRTTDVNAPNQFLNANRALTARREWRLNRLNITTPEAKLSASGQWSDARNAATNSVTTTAQTDKRITDMEFKLDIADSGKLLNRFNIKDAVSGGKGKMEGKISWNGSPLSMNYPTMTGKFNINIEKGLFLKADPGISKLLSILSMQSITKRLNLDFRDVFNDGFAFDFVRGDVAIDRGIASTNNLQMSGVNAVVLIDGKSDIAKETQDLRVVIAPEVNAGVASLLVATAINPAIGIGTFLAQLFLRQPLIEAITKELQVKGTWSEPEITEVKRTPKTSEKAPEKTTESAAEKKL